MDQFYDVYLAFTEEVDTNSSLRKLEMTQIHNLINDNMFEGSKKIHIVRSSIPLLYAHYEGFLKFIFKETILSLKKLDLNISHIKPKFLILSILLYIDENTTNQYSKGRKLIDMFDHINYSSSNNFFDIFGNENFITNFKLDHRTVNYTLSLLSIEYEDICTTINSNMYLKKETAKLLKIDTFDEFNIDTIKHVINLNNTFLDKLYNKRNTFAHGDLDVSSNQQFSINELTDSKLLASIKYFNQSFNKVLFLIELIKVVIFDYMQDKKFLLEYES